MVQLVVVRCLVAGGATCGGECEIVMQVRASHRSLHHANWSRFGISRLSLFRLELRCDSSQSRESTEARADRTDDIGPIEKPYDGRQLWFLFYCESPSLGFSLLLEIVLLARPLKYILALAHPRASTVRI